MAQWADYGISAVHYEGTSIQSVRARKIDENNEVGEYEVMTVESVLDKIRHKDNPKTFITLTKNDDGSWKEGAPVEPDGEEHIWTDRNETDDDNLSNLPTF